MLEFVCGKPRAGKTSYVVAHILNDDLKYINSRYYHACSYIKTQNRLFGTNLSLPPQRHVVSANFDIYRSYPNMRSYHISGFEFGVPYVSEDGTYSTKKLIPHGVYIFDECQKYWDSKDTRPLPPWVTQAFEWRGHIFLDIYLITQKPIRLHSDIRATVDTFTCIDKSVHTFIAGGRKVKSTKFISGVLIHTKFYGRHFDNEDDCIMYYSGKDKTLGEKFTYDFVGDIREHYNPYAYATNMENLDQDYAYLDDTQISARPKEWDTFRKTMKETKPKK